MYYLIIFGFLFLSAITEADALWTKYSLPDTINCITSYNDFIWMGTENGVVKMNRNDKTLTRFTSEKDNLAEKYINYIVSDNNGKIFAGSQKRIASSVVYDGGISLYDGESWKIFKKGIDGLAGNDISGICIDNNNRAWVALNDLYRIGTYENGIYFAHQVIQYFEHPQWPIKKVSTQSKEVHGGIYNWHPDNLIAGGFDVADSEFYVYVNFIIEGSATVINLWDNTLSNFVYIGKKVYSKSFGRLTIETEKNNNKIIWVFKDNNDIFYREYAITSGRLTVVNDWKILTIPITGFSHYYPTFSPIRIIIDQSHNKWFIDRDESNKKYLIKYDDVNYIPYNCPSWTDSTEITCLYADNQGFIWIGTQSDGLYRFDANNATAVETAKQSPATFTLSGAYPNPFNASTTISFTLNQPGKVNLAVYSLTGQKVRELAAGSYNAGNHTAMWDGKDDSGNAVSSGVYLARIESGGVSKVVRMAMVK